MSVVEPNGGISIGEHRRRGGEEEGREGEKRRMGKRGLTEKDSLASWVINDLDEAHNMVVATTFHHGYFVADAGKRTVGAFTSIGPGEPFPLGHSFDDFDSLTKRHVEKDEHEDIRKMIKEQQTGRAHTTAKSGSLASSLDMSSPYLTVP